MLLWIFRIYRVYFGHTESVFSTCAQTRFPSDLQAGILAPAGSKKLCRSLILEQNQTFSVRPFSWNSTFCIKNGLQWTYFTILASKQGSILQRMYFHQFRGNFTKFAEFRKLSWKKSLIFRFFSLAPVGQKLIWAWFSCHMRKYGSFSSQKNEK